MSTLKFAHRYGNGYVEAFDSLEAAVLDAVDCTEAGTESFDFIEHEGRILDGNAAEIRAETARRSEEWKAELRSRPKPTHWIKVATPDGKDWYHAETIVGDRAEREAHWVALVGSERVKVERIPVYAR